MEIATAYRDQILIPVVKSESEEMKSAAQFVAADKGGLVFQPILGLHQDVAELDFTSMFPTIMDRFNLSAETLNCSCCAPGAAETPFPSGELLLPSAALSRSDSLRVAPDTRVPGLGSWACQKRRGLIPKTIAPLVAKRAQYKRLAKAASDPAQKEKYKRRVSCLKWALVTVFGYTGYRNARFGKIEAHEAINAYGRDALLRAKELAEARGFKMLHAIVDALYITKPRARDDEYPELIRAISDATRLPIELEGIYRWIAFLPSRQDPRLPVANRYFGVFRDGETKVRGIELRRHDTPPFIKRAQTEMIALLAQARTAAEFRACLPAVLALTADYLDALHAGQVPFAQLAITQRLTREPRAYKTNHINAIVARQFLDSGIELAPGERIRYIILDNAARVPSDRARPVERLDGSLGYDADRYAELLLRSVSTLVAPLGISQARLESYFAAYRVLRAERAPQRSAAPNRPARALPVPRGDLPLFEWAKQHPPPDRVYPLSLQIQK
jgi:DNA polymerase-2